VKTRVAASLLCAALLVAGCGKKSDATSAAAPARPAPRASDPPPRAYGYEVVNVFPHDRAAFTQGLVYLKGLWIEGTGLHGASAVRKVEPATGRVLAETRLSAQYFGEGLTVLDGRIFQLTWQNHRGFIYDLSTLTREAEFTYTGEGWGLATDGRALILSDGTHEIRFLDPKTFKVTRTIGVFRAGQPLAHLNELEFIRGEIYANLWQTDTIARIDPADGRLLGLIDFSGLLPPGDRRADTDVLNGIAYDEAGDRLFVTGKNWPKIFEVRLREK
jgi:glutaminyl-peptide cyclotransferase